MKKITFLVAGLLFGSLAVASESMVFSGSTTTYFVTPVDYRNAEPVVFLERGIEFLIFPNGELDFNTQPATTNNGHGSRGNSQTNTTYGAPGSYNPGQGVRVDHDAKGRVRRVGNVFINYDSMGRVKRIGTVYMSYNSFALAQIGGLRLIYDRLGRIVDTYGYINANNRGYTYNPCNDGYDNGNGYNGNDGGYNTGNGNNSDNDYYYYRKAKPGTKQ
ncbi:MAG: hypothetical protein V4581_05500 [Bacteroidota bacterium]